MRRAILPLLLAALLAAGSQSASAEETFLRPAQAAAPRADSGWTAGKVVVIGIGAVAGVMVANATLPMAWGMATPIVGAIVGGTVGSWVHTRATEPSMLGTRASMSVAAPSLFHMASLVVAE